ELDSDKDGVVDSKDMCPETLAGVKVNLVGCELDSDYDGVINRMDLCPDTAPGTKVDVTGCQHDAPITLKGVNFRSGSDELLEESKLILDGVVAILVKYSSLRVEIAGHTDNTGRESANLNLSQRRAESVRAYLISKGVLENNLTAQGYGESQPIADNQTSAGKAQNRRVELHRLD
ncbi:MAG: OmpA family protein, partial [Gammaproteobacteria bacterium]|nr:OmpA family protein [Gammaproteobacteria bacterium]